ncbi:MAG: hypothetical protein JXC32_21975, partial [Anaerolineae bacterium]|nr:hypothetical protein [Anaerolineae bacterium]
MTCALIDGCDTTQYAYQPSNSLVGCFMVLDDYPRLSELKGRNYWWQAFPEPVDYEKPDATQKPTMMFVGSESANGARYEGLASQPDTLTVFVPGSFDQAKDAFDRGPDFYTTYKEKIGAAILSAVQAHLFSDLAPSLRAMLILTPWDLYQELGAEAGNVYGRRLDVRNMLRKVKGLPSVSNLRIACATVGNPGIETAFQTAVAVVEELTGERI